jgi:ribosomal protein S27AE
MPLKRDREGYLLIDNRESPGVSPELVHQAGKAGETPIVTAGQLFESATITCAHCNAVVILNPHRTRPRNYCAKCDHYVCDKPSCALECRPFKKVLDELYEQAVRAAEQKGE